MQGSPLEGAKVQTNSSSRRGGGPSKEAVGNFAEMTKKL